MRESDRAEEALYEGEVAVGQSVGRWVVVTKEQKVRCRAIPFYRGEEEVVVADVDDGSGWRQRGTGHSR